MNYLEGVKLIFDECCSDGKIRSMQSWEDFMKKLCINKMISREEMTSIDKKVLIFPMDYDHMINTVTSYFCPSDLQDIEYQVDCFENQVKEYKSLVFDWNVHGYENKDLQTLLKIFNKLEIETKDFRKDFEKEMDDLMNMNEKHLHHKDEIVENTKFKDLGILDQDTISSMTRKGVKSSFVYQEKEGHTIEKDFFGKRVRGVHYRNQPIKVLYSYEDGVQRVIGYDQDRDVPIEVFKIPKIFPHDDRLVHLLNTFEAYKEMSHSIYFVDYYGYNSVSEPDHNLFFMQLVKQRRLIEYVEESAYRLTIDMVLFKFWAKEIFLAFKDLLETCTYNFKMPVSLYNIFPMDSGTKLLFSDIEFLQRRACISESQEYIESKLLKNYAMILLQLLNYKSVQELKEDTEGEHIEFITFLETLMDSKTQLKRYINGNTNFRLTFDKLLHHPFFKDFSVNDADLLELADNFDLVFLTHNN